MLGKLAMLGSALVLLIILQSTESALTIGSFNIQRLGNSKSSNATIVNHIVQVLHGFDIAVILEVIDTDAVNVVIQALNRNGGPYSLKLSSASGRTSYKEHVAILYRNDKLSAVQVREFPDAHDQFERDPYAVLFHTTQAGVSTFAVVEFTNVLIAGDFNADCTYMTEAQFKNSALVTDHRFTFLIDMNVDTTASVNTNCAYDRFVVAGK
ncbi:deoxyribonuclease-1-like [Pomacea canaliculata]|uniref:deoxyribonuclease-1-like n=1 Tax=Pomacea canaliculata TaxID=400727 RepID=UPI000D72D457|nr:deoxyribonuclease-1-like [Pomacea canaliculata]